MKFANRILAGIAALALAAALTACGGSSSSAADSVAPSSESVASSASSASAAESASASAAANDAIVINGITFDPQPVPNDVTGNWRISCINESLDMSECAQEYYNLCFMDDSEIHFVVNTADSTTTKLASVGSDIDVVVQEYVPNEEQDAKVLGGGSVIAEYFVGKETGEIEKIR